MYSVFLTPISRSVLSEPAFDAGNLVAASFNLGLPGGYGWWLLAVGGAWFMYMVVLLLPNIFQDAPAREGSQSGHAKNTEHCCGSDNAIAAESMAKCGDDAECNYCNQQAPGSCVCGLGC